MRLSLCIVARNEELYIGPCIRSALPIADEIIVVDTGSTDGTIDRAREAGAQVFQEPWPGDLAKAHDLPLAHATGDWVLTLDGDELLDPHRRDTILELVQDPQVDGYFITVRNYAYRPGPKWRRCDPTDELTRGASGWRPSRAVRLFRNRPEYRNEGLVHQTVVHSILRTGGTVAETDVPIHHYGHVRVDRAKNSLYSSLARRQTLDAPDDPRAWLDMGILLLGSGRLAAALQAFLRARELGRVAEASFYLGQVLAASEHHGEALSLLERAIAENPDDACPDFDRADAYEVIGDIEETLGRPLNAIEAYRAAVANRPYSPQSLNNLAGLLSEQGQHTEALGILEELTSTTPGMDMPWATLGTARLRLGDLVGAEQALDRALDILPYNLPALLNRALVHELRGEDEAARILRSKVHAQFGEQAYEGAGMDVPTAAPGDGADDEAPAEAGDAAQEPDVPRGAVVSVIEQLAGGGGRVCVDVVQVLGPTRPQVVLVGEAGNLFSQGLMEALQAEGVPVISYVSRADLRLRLQEMEPSLVIYHWWHPAISGPTRAGEEPWIAVGHAALPMPVGYDAYVVLSDYHAQFQTHLPPDRVHRLPNAVDLARFDAPPRAGKGPVTVAVLSRLAPEKLPRRLLSFLPDLRALDARLLIAGQGGRRWEIEPELASKGLGELVRFVGLLSTADVPAFLAKADIGLHLTETHEELLSMTLLEMLASGLPVVGQPRGCLPELVEHGHNGFLAEAEGDVRGHLEALIRDPELRDAQGRASRAASTDFGFDTYRRRWEELLTWAHERLPGRGGLPPVSVQLGPAQPASDRRLLPSGSYILAATPRSGSNLLCEALIQTGLAGFPSEALNPYERDAVGAWSWRGASPTEHLASLQDYATTPNGIFGMKVMWGHLAQFSRELAHECGGPPEPSHARLAELFPGLRWIWIRRGDRLRQAVSLVRANQTGAWVRDAERPSAVGTRARYDFDAIREAMVHLDRMEAAWSTFFQAAGVQPVQVAFEDVVGDYEGTAVRLLDALGIEHRGRLYFGPRRLRSQSDESTDAWINRFQAEA